MLDQRWPNLRKGREQDNIFEKFYSYQCIGSTNGIAKQLLQTEKVSDYFVVSAKTQTQGKGRWGREWWSPEGGLWCSLVTPKISIPSLRATFSVVQVIRKLTPLRAGIRWPNDIIIRNKKVGGVLTESEKEGLIIGIGVNINQESFPPELSEATSLKIEMLALGVQNFAPLRVQDFLDAVVNEFESNLNNSEIIDQIRDVLVLFGEKITVKVRDGIKTGELWNVEEDGSLLLREDIGIISKLIPSEVEFIR